MKKVIFICLLSLSMCFSAPDPQQGTPKQENTPAPQNNPPHQSSPVQQTPPVQTPLVQQSPQHNETTPSQPAQQTPNVTPQQTTNNTVPQTQTLPNANETTPKAGDTNKSDKVTPDQKPGDKGNKIEPANENSPVNPKGGNAIDNSTKTNESTDKQNAIVPTTTLKPTATTIKPTLQARGFDGPSFFGGIVLTLGLLAIGIIGLKYYRNQTERNYHTL